LPGISNIGKYWEIFWQGTANTNNKNCLQLQTKENDFLFSKVDCIKGEFFSSATS